METLAYLIKINLAITIFYFIYRTCYRSDTFFSLRRYLLLSMFGLSIIYPFLDFSHWFMQNKSLTEAAIVYIQYMPDLTITPVDTTSSTYSYTDYILAGYWGVLGIILIRLLIRIFQIVWIRMRSSVAGIENVPVYRLQKQTAPFSFFSWIFVNPEMHKPAEIHEIMTHELVHVHQKHSIDILFSEIVCAFCWFNPMAWLLKQEILQNLEFIVDEKVIKTGINPKSYQYHLLRLADYPAKISIANQFNVSPLKKRIMMLNKKQSPKIKLTAYTLIFPLIVSFVIANNAGAVIDRISENSEFKSIVTAAFDKTSFNETPPAEKPTTSSVFSKTKKIEVTGRLVDKENEKPLAGVNIIIFGTNTGTISDQDGNFKLNVQEGDSILFSYIGYTGLAYAIKNQPADIGTLQMKRKREELSEVVVVGYGRSTANNLPNTAPQQIENQANENETIFIVVEEMPEFPGGSNELMNFIAKSIKYPVYAQENKIQGRVVCTFTVNADGSIVDAKVTRGIAPSLDSEALRIIYSMPKWKPGKQRGKAVSVEYTLPINFRLQS